MIDDENPAKEWIQQPRIVTRLLSFTQDRTEISIIGEILSTEVPAAFETIESVEEVPDMVEGDLRFVFTQEGVIVDLLTKNGDPVSTSSLTYDEVIERLLQ